MHLILLTIPATEANAINIDPKPGMDQRSHDGVLCAVRRDAMRCSQREMEGFRDRLNIYFIHVNGSDISDANT